MPGGIINHKFKGKQRDPHVGGFQLPLITPPSTWTPPSSLPAPETLGGVISLDTETKDNGLSAKRGPGWAHHDGYVCGVSIAWHGEGSDIRSLYAPISHPDTECFSKEQVADWLRAIHRRGIKLIFQNAPYDLGWLLVDLGVDPPTSGDLLEDTTAKSVMIDENRFSYALDDLLKWRGLPGKDETLLREAAAAYGFHGSEVKKNIWRMAGRYAGPYAEQDAVGTLMLAESLDETIDADGVREAFRLECDLIPMVLEMRRRGIRIDIDAAHDAIDLLHRSRDDALAFISKELGQQVSMAEVRNLTWLEKTHDNLGIRYPRTPKTQRGSFTSGSRGGWMQKHPHPIPKAIAKAEKYEDAAHKVVEGFVLNYCHKGRVHATVNQFRSNDEESGGTKGTRSHRFSYDNPPLQQMPERDEEIGPLVRSLFLAEDGEVWGAHDYSQQEYRIVVHGAATLGASRAEEAVRQYCDDPDTDFHNLVVEWTGLDRKKAKDANFGKAFGAGVPKFADMIGKTKEEAAEIYEQYDRELPFVNEAAKKCTQLASRRGYVRLIDGARCHFDMWEPAYRESGMGYIAPMPRASAEKQWPGIRLRRSMTHKAFNRYVQGSAARQTKLAMRQCWNEGHVPMLQMHDDLNFSHSCHEQGIRVAAIMENIVQLRVPMKVDSEYGRSWGTARKSDGHDASWKSAVRLVRRRGRA